MPFKLLNLLLTLAPPAILIFVELSNEANYFKAMVAAIAFLIGHDQIT